jgi:hypothetical protein
MDWTGGCLCGDIRFRVTKDPVSVAHCHCSLCRKQTCAAFTTGVNFATEAFEWTKGKPDYFRDPVGVDRSFCARCGSSMTWEPTRGGICVFVGSLDRARDVHPTCHVYTSTMLPWVTLNDGLPQYPEGDPDWYQVGE